MINTTDYNIDDETITKVGLLLCEKPIKARNNPFSRVFEYPALDNVFVMESDLYGNEMPKDSCFLAFSGAHGLIGKDLKVETLKQSSVEQIRKMIECNVDG